MGGGFNLDDYVDVAERLEKFHDKYPEGSLQGTYKIEDLAEKGTFLVYIATAHRDREDPRPGIGMAWEPVPGHTPYTKDSELMNAETSAWGRALAGLGFETKRGIASKQEVQNRRGGSSNGSGTEASPAQKRLLTTLLKEQGLSKDAQKAIVRWRCGQEKATKAGASQLIDEIKEQGITGDVLLVDLHAAAADGNEDAVEALKLIPSEVPADTDGLPDAPEGADLSDFADDGKAAVAPQPGEPEAF